MTSYGAPVALTPVTTLNELLDLEELDRNLYRARNEDNVTGRPTLFGGQVLAQALRAAAFTVDEARLPHSCHGYFLRPGQPERPVILRVDRDRDGRSFSARHVVAIQDGDEIFTLTASFHRVEESGALETPMPEGVPPPEAPARAIGWHHRTVELKIVDKAGETEDGPPTRLWVRAMQPLADDPVVHACALAYISDIGSGFGASTLLGLPRGGPSLDHALWFQHPIRLDDWVLLDMWPVKAGGARGLYMGTVHDHAGVFGALFTQEMLMRPIGT